MKLGASSLAFTLGLLSFATVPAVAQDHAGPLTRLAERFRSHHHVHTHAPVAAAAPVAQAAGAECECPSDSDPYGFVGVLNRIRASAGLNPVAYDPNLSSWASQNNAEQCRRGLGHHVNPCGVQNCAWNYPDASSTAEGWMNSPGHRRNMLSPSITHVGIAFGPGPYWTLNAR
jgi:uncharacterized protein YkwD